MTVEIGPVLLLFGILCVGLLTSLPVAFALSLSGIVVGALIHGQGFLNLLPFIVYEKMSSFTLVALPLYILIGTLLERGLFAKDLYDSLYKWLSGVPGGLAAATVIIGGAIAAMVGMVGPGIITLGLIALPSMLEHGFDKKLALGSVIGSGTLGPLIPPSIQMILYASVTDISLGRLFMSGVVPGIIICTLMISYILIATMRNPQLAPRVSDRFTLKEKIVSLKGVISPVVIVVGILVSISAGICTPTEASAVGVVLVIICAAVRHRAGFWKVMKESSLRAIEITGMCVWIIIGAGIYTNIFNSIGAPGLIIGALNVLPISPLGVVWLIHAILILLGFVMDDYAILMVAAPVFAPVVAKLGLNPLWFACTFIVNLQLSLQTPPYGFSLFFLSSVAPKGTTMQDIIIASIPFTLIKVLALILVIQLPQIVLWLPTLLMD